MKFYPALAAAGHGSARPARVAPHHICRLYCLPAQEDPNSRTQNTHPDAHSLMPASTFRLRRGSCHCINPRPIRGAIKPLNGTCCWRQRGLTCCRCPYLCVDLDINVWGSQGFGARSFHLTYATCIMLHVSRKPESSNSIHAYSATRWRS